MHWIDLKYGPSGPLPHPLDQYIRVSQLDPFKHINSGFLEPGSWVKVIFKEFRVGCHCNMVFPAPITSYQSQWRSVPFK